MAEQRLYLVIRILAIGGIALAIFLLWEQFFRPAFQPCNINATINCDAIISGEVAKTLGLPTPIYGLVGYIIIFIAATVRRPKLILGIASFGLLFCLWIAYRELFQLHVICPVCLACQLIMITVFSLAIYLNFFDQLPAVDEPTD